LLRYIIGDSLGNEKDHDMNYTRIALAGLAATMMALALLYALAFRDRSSLAQGMRFALLVGVFAAGSFVLHNYVSLNIGLRLALLQAIAYFVQLVGAGVVISLIYRPVRL